MQQPPLTCTAFSDRQRIASGSLIDVVKALKAVEDAERSPPLIFDDMTGRQVEVDLRGDVDQVLGRLPQNSDGGGAPATRGRPRLGVKSKEITLLPSHWEWLAGQPGGASAALRRLVDQARRSGPDKVREATEAAHRIMFAIAGDERHFEEATRAFYAKDYARFDTLSAEWPQDVGDYVRAFVRRVAALSEPQT